MIFFYFQFEALTAFTFTMTMTANAQTVNYWGINEFDGRFNYIAFEYPVARPSWWYDIVDGLPDPIVKDGFIDVWDRPGLGGETHQEQQERQVHRPCGNGPHHHRHQQDACQRNQIWNTQDNFPRQRRAGPVSGACALVP